MVKREELMKKDSTNNTNGGYVYVLLANDKTVKIGITTNPYRRISQIETASGKDIIKWELTKPCSNFKDIERYLHKEFKKYRLKGEWFNVNFTDVIEVLSNIELEDAESKDVKEVIQNNIKGISLAYQLMIEFRCKEYNYTTFKYNIDYNINDEHVKEIEMLVEENIEANKEMGLEYSHLYEYINRINSKDKCKAVVDYCIDYIDLIGDNIELLIELGLYDTFDNILNFTKESRNYIADEFIGKEMQYLYEEYGEDLVKSIVYNMNNQNVKLIG